jgi:hypothetical protein
MSRHEMGRHPLPSWGRVDQSADGPAPMTVESAKQPMTSAQNQPPRPDTVAQQVFRGIVSVNAALAEHRQQSLDPKLTEQAQREKLAEFGQSEYAKALPVYDTIADELVAQKKAAYDETLKSLTPQGDTAA